MVRMTFHRSFMHFLPPLNSDEVATPSGQEGCWRSCARRRTANLAPLLTRCSSLLPYPLFLAVMCMGADHAGLYTAASQTDFEGVCGSWQPCHSASWYLNPKNVQGGSGGIYAIAPSMSRKSQHAVFKDTPSWRA